jgi:uncharacterized membrane protein YfcA
MKQKTKTFSLALTSLLSGFCNALLGAGGGILLTLFMGRALKKEIPDRRDLLVTSQAAMIPGCALSCIIYGLTGVLDTEGFSILAIPAAIGGAIGSILLTRINSKWIKRIFAVLVIWSGARMIIG